GVPFFLLLVAFALGIVAVEVFVTYQQYARVLKVLSLALLAYIVTGVVIHPQWGKLLVSTLIPQIRFTPAYLALVVAMLGTTISPYLFFWQTSEEVEEASKEASKEAADAQAIAHAPDPAPPRLALRKRLKDLRLDTALGMLASQVTTWFIIVTASGT